MVLQQHCGGGSHMAVAFLVRCCLFVSLPIQHGTVSDGDFMSWRRLLAMAVWLCSGFVLQWSGIVRVDVPIRLGRVCLVETNCVVCVDVPIQPS